MNGTIPPGELTDILDTLHAAGYVVVKRGTNTARAADTAAILAAVGAAAGFEVDPPRSPHDPTR